MLAARCRAWTARGHRRGVLAQDTTVCIAGDSTGAPDVGGLRLLSRIYLLTPHGLNDAPARTLDSV
ncbi:MAG: hypothetical protein HS106_00525 [Ideonella sp.]|nr:hypothetical protein [Ideonella sp.]